MNIQYNSQRLILLVLTIVFSLGFFQSKSLFSSFNYGSPFFVFVALTIAISPLIPLIAIIFKTLFQTSLSEKLIKLVVFSVGLFGLVVTLVVAAFSGVGTNITLLHGITLTLGMVAGVLILSKRNAYPVQTSLFAIWIAPMIVATWSLATIPAIYMQASKIAKNQSYCIGPHDNGPTIVSLAQLRGLSFYSTASGYKDSSHWYFHGVLLIKTKNGLIAYNWSPRNFKFDKIEQPNQLFIDPLNACIPSENFLENLNVF